MEESPENELTEIDAKKLPDMEFKVMVIRMLKELNENYISLKKDIETMNKNHLEIKNTIFDMKNTLEGIKCRLDEPEDQISNLENKVKKTNKPHPIRETNKEDFKRMRMV